MLRDTWLASCLATPRRHCTGVNFGPRAMCFAAPWAQSIKYSLDEDTLAPVAA